MAISNEKLALLYNESDDKRGKQKIFLELKENLREKTSKIINLWVKRFSSEYNKSDDRQTYSQIADMMILSTLETSKFRKADFVFEQWYIMILKNSLFDYNKDKNSVENLDICMDFQEEAMDNVVSHRNEQDFSQSVDNKVLYDILKLYIDKLDFWSSEGKDSNYYKNIFLESLGFNEEKDPKSYAELAQINNCTRQNIRDCCMRYTKKLVKLLEKDNKLEELRQYL